MTLRALLLFLCSAPLLAAVGTSANYTLAVGTLDGGGGKGVTSNYEIDFPWGPGSPLLRSTLFPERALPAG